MIEAEPAGLLSPHYRLTEGAAPWTELRFDDHAGDASFILDGRRYRARAEIPRESAWRMVARAVRGRQLYRLEEDGGVIAHAQGGGLRARHHLWTGAGASYDLREEDGAVHLLGDDGAALGRIARRGGLARGLQADLSDTVPAPIRAFIIWLLLRRWETIHRG